ncbi:D-aminoacylase [Gemmatimonas sp.]|uniref:N-acyl-D-amino-acid deacylase family protein n=1 Tax=Gemmatimonas sp. TaxID=1962908 RepID=UPI0022C2308A|nr:D-aminoacylase [Gemmatimonas sp.]MCZ8203443.1 D-aminoacylase [Gemmatimonas sp.]
MHPRHRPSVLQAAVCRTWHAVLLGSTLLFASACNGKPAYDVVIRGGTVYDGSGGAPRTADVAIRGDSIVAVGTVPEKGQLEVDATGLAVAPGFINMLSWATESLIEDGRSQGDIRQGVTLEVMGEGESMGPLSDTLRAEMLSQQGDIRYPITWRTLRGYQDSLVKKGISTNIASFVGATTLRINHVGWDNREPTAAELAAMQADVRTAMEEGALGVGSSLIYAPAFYAKTPELVALMKAAAPYGGMYISHLRSEGGRFDEAVEELMTIARESGARAEIYHLKAAGEANWPKMAGVLARIDSARAAGLEITADIYPYTAGATGLDAAMPPWVQEGGYAAWAKRLRDPAIRRKVAQEMRTPTDQWESLLLAAGSPERVVLAGFKADSLKQYTGKTLAAVAALRGTTPEETAMDLVVKDGTRVGTIYFIINEDNIAAQLRKPWVSVGSDAASMATEGAFLKSNTHPRAYGTFARFLGKYVRDEQVLTLQEGIRRLTSLPATNLRIARRGWLKPGYHADVVVFDPRTIRDNATFEQPHQYATGVRDVFVNGVQVLKEGEHTGATPGRVVLGPGAKR